MSIKTTFKNILIGLAIGLGTAAYIAWKILRDQSELRKAKQFLSDSSIKNEHKEQVLSDLEIQTTDFEEKAKQLKQASEEQTKEEIIYAFKKAFHVDNVSDNPNQPAGRAD